MGDRGNIGVIHRSVVGGEKVVGYTFLYTHWSGSEIQETLKTALSRKLRWDDAQYLTRIIFDTLSTGQQGKETGFGIGPFIGDNSHRILLVDPDRKVVRLYEEDALRVASLEHKEPGKPIRSWSFVSFIGEEKTKPDA